MELKLFGYEARLEVVVACIIIGMLVGLFMFCDCFQYSILEGMTPNDVNNKTANGKSAGVKEGFVNLSNNELNIDDSYTMGWVKTAKRYASGMGNKNRLNTYKDNVGTPVPLPEGELFFLPIINSSRNAARPRILTAWAAHV